MTRLESAWRAQPRVRYELARFRVRIAIETRWNEWKEHEWPRDGTRRGPPICMHAVEKMDGGEGDGVKDWAQSLALLGVQAEQLATISPEHEAVTDRS
jgi:hypothetical protein